MKNQNKSQAPETLKIDESGYNSFDGNKQRRNEEQIRLKAYDLAERRNFEPGHELEDWLWAERIFNG